MTKKSKILFATFFLLSGVGIVCLFRRPAEHSAVETAALLGALALFLVASVVIFCRPRVALGVSIAAAVLLLACVSWNEWALSPWANSWIALNASDRFTEPYILVAVATILTTAVALAGLFCSILRLLPGRWFLRRRPFGERTWLAVALTAVLMSIWFVWCARPYREPEILDGPGPTLRVLRVEKRGLWFHETLVSTSRDGRFWISSDDRRFFQYQFQKSIAEGEMPPAVEVDAKALVQSLESQPRPTQPPNTLRSWDAEGWYVFSGDRSGLLTFTTENGTTPPFDLVRVFSELDGLAPALTQRSVTRDICLGFCYDPTAGLGFTAANQRCTYLPDGHTCR